MQQQLALHGQETESAHIRPLALPQTEAVRANNTRAVLILGVSAVALWNQSVVAYVPS